MAELESLERLNASTRPSGLPSAFAPVDLDVGEERQSVFTSLVTGDTDVIGLVAYSIYKQNKHDFLVAFTRRCGRQPDDAELFAYKMGEATPRRLAIYRHLAESTLAGRSLDVQTAPGLQSAGKPAPWAGLKSAGGSLLLATFAMTAFLSVWLIARFGFQG